MIKSADIKSSENVFKRNRTRARAVVGGMAAERGDFTGIEGRRAREF
jgi:hypothetical protein